MKKIGLVAVLALSLAACDNKPDTVEETVSGSSGTPQSLTDTLKNMGADLREEMQEYSAKIKNRLDEMNDDLEEAREKRKAERDLKKQKEEDAAIEERERRRRELEQKWEVLQTNTKTGWNKMESDVSAGWKKFKNDVDDFFNNDHTPYKHRRDSINH